MPWLRLPTPDYAAPHIEDLRKALAFIDAHAKKGCVADNCRNCVVHCPVVCRISCATLAFARFVEVVVSRLLERTLLKFSLISLQVFVWVDHVEPFCFNYLCSLTRVAGLPRRRISASPSFALVLVLLCVLLAWPPPFYSVYFYLGPYLDIGLISFDMPYIMTFFAPLASVCSFCSCLSMHYSTFTHHLPATHAPYL